MATLRERISTEPLSEFMHYLASNAQTEDGRVPTLAELSQRLGVSVSTLREQLEVARALGLVEVRPRTGIRRLPFSFLPAVEQSLAYAVAVDPEIFHAYADLRNHVEIAYWYQAVSRLTAEDHAALRKQVECALEKLGGTPIQIPMQEHRELHLLIYRRLDNPFVQGLLEAYWDMYEAIGLSVYTDIAYLQKVWRFHARMVEAICNGNFTDGYQALVEHNDLLYQRAQPANRQKFE